MFSSGAGNAPNLQLCLSLTYFLLPSSVLQERKTTGTAVQIKIEKGNEETLSRDCHVKSNIRNSNKDVAPFCSWLVEMVHRGLF